MHKVTRSSKKRAKREAVEAEPRLLGRIRAQAKIRRLRGKVHWEGDLEVSRVGPQAQ